MIYYECTVIRIIKYNSNQLRIDYYYLKTFISLLYYIIIKILVVFLDLFNIFILFYFTLYLIIKRHDSL